MKSKRYSRAPKPLPRHEPKWADPKYKCRAPSIPRPLRNGWETTNPNPSLSNTRNTNGTQAQVAIP